MAEQENSTINIQKPSKTLHFSDGTLEIFDDEPEELPEPESEINEVSSFFHF